MAKPAQVPTWATAATFTIGDQVGDTTKLEPSSGEKAQGFVPGFSFLGRFVNWLINLICLWCAYVDNLHNEPEFLQEEYDWSAKHDFLAGADFNGPTLLNDVTSSFYSSIALVTPETRTIWLNPRHASQFGYPSSTPGDGWVRAQASSGFAGYWTADAGNGVLMYDLACIPDYCVITRVRVTMHRKSDATATLRVDAATDNLFTTTSTPLAGSGTGTVTLDTGTIALTVRKDLNTYTVWIDASSDSDGSLGSDILYSVRVDYTMNELGVRT